MDLRLEYLRVHHSRHFRDVLITNVQLPNGILQIV